MDQEQENQLADIPASEPVATAAPEPEETTPESSEPTPKTFTQEELDAAIGKRLAREQRKWEREQARKTTEVKPPAELPPVDQFESVDAYAEALAEQKAAQKLAAIEAEKYKFEVLETYQEREEEARNKYDDFEQVAYNPRLPITDTMAEAIQASDIGPDIAYYLGSNPKEAARIADLKSPVLQAKELGKIEAKLASDPPVKKTTSAPAPITPVAGRGTGAPSYDTTDPRSMKNMSTSEWIEAERQRQVRKWEAQRNR